ncbi:NADAR family protein [Asticcacaulis solisilvae]|uniref:NADAR family protein n=1 Tax=Asticcacaulis solisilvae TaxID=1217274 RepID=UPI003FD7BC0F
MYYDRAAVENAFKANEPQNFLFFWGHQPSKDGRITSSCLSQWWQSAFEVDGVVYRTAEHWMMVHKARLFGDDETATKILAAESPKQVKQLGREARGFDAARWDARKLAVVQDGNFHKFSQNVDLRDYLLATGDRVLVEASPVDPVWGIGLAADNPDAADPSLWKGDNLLGFALMHARERLR